MPSDEKIRSTSYQCSAPRARASAAPPPLPPAGWVGLTPEVVSHSGSGSCMWIDSFVFYGGGLPLRRAHAKLNRPRRLIYISYTHLFFTSVP